MALARDQLEPGPLGHHGDGRHVLLARLHFLAGDADDLVALAPRHFGQVAHRDHQHAPCAGDGHHPVGVGIAHRLRLEHPRPPGQGEHRLAPLLVGEQVARLGDESVAGIGSDQPALPGIAAEQGDELGPVRR